MRIKNQKPEYPSSNRVQTIYLTIIIMLIRIDKAAS